MTNKINYDIYQSPFSWRYGSPAMREIFSELNRRTKWRKVWVSLAQSQSKMGLINEKELADIVKFQDSVDIEKAHEIEKEIKHDLMAELKTYAGQAKLGGGKIHFGATSQDIEDNADTVLFKEAILIIETELKALLLEFSKKIDEYKDFVCMAYTHLQPAEPTTLGYRFSIYAQDLLLDLELLEFIKKQIKGKGFKGAVGNSASYYSLLNDKADALEKDVLDNLGIDAFDVATQVYPRKLDYLVLSLLASIAGSLHKFAFDVRILQSAGFGEIQEPFGEKQVGSSAMPFKRNPILSERICSIARHIVNLSRTAWDNAANSLLERTLDDSASRRIILPESFLATDEILSQAAHVVAGLKVNKVQIQKNLEKFGPFSASEALMMQAVKNGGDRQELHEIIRDYSMKSYESNKPLDTFLAKDKTIAKYLSDEQIKEALDYSKHTGLAAKKSTEMAERIEKLAR